MIGKSRAVVSNQISGKKQFSREAAALFSKALGYNINFLLYGEGSLLEGEKPQDVIIVPSEKDKTFDASILASLLQVAGDLFAMTGDKDAQDAWEAINRGDFEAYNQCINYLVKRNGTHLKGSPILVKYLANKINDTVRIAINPSL